jgi:hypothetical protein
MQQVHFEDTVKLDCVACQSRDEVLTYDAIMIANGCDTFVCHAIYVGCDCSSFQSLLFV